ncbi:MAG: thioredoxin family protein [Immundisolibacteraceae bacterium]|nr:thioredoxin family protein [Immundisolibacteraceae bacterium]
MKIAVNTAWMALMVLFCAAVSARTLIYDPGANPRHDLAQAVASAATDDKRVLVVFGADWCPDCRMLDHHMNREPLKAVINDNFHVVKVDVGEKDKNLDFLATFGNPIAGGIPAIAILDNQSTIHYVSDAGELASARSAKTEGLKQWFQSLLGTIDDSEIGDSAR